MAARGRAAVAGACPAILPARRSAAFTRFFGRYCRRLVGRKFHASLIEPASLDYLKSLDDEPGPVLVCMSHQSWWDPIFITLLATSLMPGRAGFGAIDSAMHRRFRFMARLGAFGINPEDPASLRAMVSYAGGLFAEHDRPSVWITPQGRFADPRDPIRIRPGAPAIAAAYACCVVALSIEYTLWHEPRPVACIRAREIAAPSRGGLLDWHRAIQAGMRANAAALADLVIARDEGAFVPLVRRRGPTVNPAYDLWQRVTGRIAAVTPRPSPRRESAA